MIKNNEMLVASTERMFQGLERLQYNLDSLSRKMESGEAKTEARFEKLDEDLGELRKKVEELEQQRSATVDRSACSGLSSETGGGTSSRLAAAKTLWLPEAIECKGWVTDWSNPQARSQQMKTGKEIEEMLREICSHLPRDKLRSVDEEKTKRVNSGRVLYGKLIIKMRSGTAAEEVWSLRKFLEDTQTSMTKVPAEAKYMVDAPPWKKPHIVAKAKMFSAMREAGVQMKDITSETGPPESKIYRTARQEGDRPTLLASYSEGKGWNVIESVLQEMCPSSTAAGLMRAYDRA